jgi:hypothetical protein
MSSRGYKVDWPGWENVTIVPDGSLASWTDGLSDDEIRAEFRRRRFAKAAALEAERRDSAGRGCAA